MAAAMTNMQGAQYAARRPEREEHQPEKTIAVPMRGQQSL
jgi:hypothetical protein